MRMIVDCFVVKNSIIAFLNSLQENINKLENDICVNILNLNAQKMSLVRLRAKMITGSIVLGF